MRASRRDVHTKPARKMSEIERLNHNIAIDIDTLHESIRLALDNASRSSSPAALAAIRTQLKDLVKELETLLSGNLAPDG